VIRDEHGELWVNGDDDLLDIGLAERRQRAMAQGAQCQRCALGGSARGPVESTIRPGARALFVIEQPNEEDITPGTLAENGLPGERFREAIQQAGASEDEYSVIAVQGCAWTGAMRDAWKVREKHHESACRAARRAKTDLPKPTHGINPVDACRPRYLRDLAAALGAAPVAPTTADAAQELDAKDATKAAAADVKALRASIDAATAAAAEAGRPFVVSPMGYGAQAPVAQAFGIPHGSTVAAAGEVKITNLDKQFLTAIQGVGKPIILPNYSVAYAIVQGNRQWAPYVAKGVQRALTIARRGRVDWTPPSMHTMPSVDEIERVLRGFIDRWKATQHKTLGRAWIGSDIETTGLERECRILCIGFAQRQADGTIESISVPIRRRVAGYEPVKGERIDHSKFCEPWPWTPEERRRIVDIIRRVYTEGGITGHNFTQFDRSRLIRAGWMGDVASAALWENAFFDTMTQNRNTPAAETAASLVTACATRFEVLYWKDDANDKASDSGGSDESLHVYNQYDCANQLRLTEAQEQEFFEHSTVDQAQTDLRAGSVYANMHEIGLPVSRKKYEEYSEKLGAARQKELADLRALMKRAKKTRGGQEVSAMSETAAETWTPTPANVRDFLFDFCEITPISATGAKRPPWEPGLTPAVDSISFSRILEERPVKGTIAEEFVNQMYEFRAVDKLLSTYLEGLTKVRHEPWCWGRPLVEWEQVPGFAEPLWMLHPTYRVAIPTGRVSTSPTIQNWPERTRAGINMRALIEAPPGHVFVGADLEQVELRIYAILANDQEMLAIFADPTIDAHAWNYATISVPDPSNKDLVRRMHDYVVRLKNSTSAKDQKEAKKLRNIAKRFVYLITYGGEPDKLFSTMASDRDKITFELNFPGITPEQTQRWYDAWHRVHPETKRWQNNCIHEAKTRGSVAGIGDYRRRFFFGGLNKRNAAANATIQGSAAFIANRGVINLSEIIRFRSWSSMTGLVLQIHDYIGAFVPVQYAEYAYEAIKREMPWNYKGMDLGVDAKISTSWAYQ
jgi:hypothetical protein